MVLFSMGLTQHANYSSSTLHVGPFCLTPFGTVVGITLLRSGRKGTWTISIVRGAIVVAWLMLCGATPTQRAIAGAAMEDEGNSKIQDQNQRHGCHKEKHGRKQHQNLT